MSGRWLSESDVDSAQHVAVINQTMATHFFGAENPLGRQVVAKAFEDKSQPPRDAYFQVVGVLRDVKDFWAASSGSSNGLYPVHHRRWWFVLFWGAASFF